MRVLITGSSGHLGEALVRVLASEGFDVVGVDTVGSSYTSVDGSILDRACVRRCVEGVDAILHA
ncbi:MAG: NAD-dependent epimerase/dehydratase family protein, partial [Acidimicrobiia bacterium]